MISTNIPIYIENKLTKEIKIKQFFLIPEIVSILVVVKNLQSNFYGF